VVHRDLKCANLFFTHDADFKIADFGCSKWPASGDVLREAEHTAVGTLFWMAPELLRGRFQLTTSVDIWSLGCCLLEMATGRPLWAERQFDNIKAACRVITESDDLPELPPGLPAATTCFVHTRLQRNPAQRPCAAELQRHPFLVSALQ